MPNQSPISRSAHIAWYCTLMSLVVTFVYFVTGWGIPPSSSALLLTLGCAFWLLLLPLRVSVAHVPIILLSNLILVAASGLVLGDRAWLIGVPLATMGFWLWIELTVQRFQNKLSPTEVSIIFCILVLSLFLSTRFWGVGYLSPLFDQNLATAAAHPDSLFHMAITSMIRTYGVASSGVAGLVSLPYHTGSHWLFAGLANSLGISTHLFFNLSYPVIFIPLLIFALTLVSQSISAIYPGKKQSPDSSVFFWILLTGGLTGWLPLVIQNWSNTEQVLYVSESYVVALTVSLLLLSHLLRSTPKKWNVSSLVLIACVLILIGFIKISFFYLWLITLSYVFVRVKWYRSWQMVGWLAVLWMAALFLHSNFSLLEHTPQLRSFNSLANLLTQPATWLWFGIEYGLLVMIIILRVTMTPKIALKNWLRYLHHHLFIDLEVVVVIALAGLLPVIFFEMPAGIENYFLDAQRWGALLILLAWVPDTFRGQKLSAVGIAIMVLINLIFSSYWYHQSMMTRRQRMLDVYGQLTIPNSHLITYLKTLDQKLVSEKKYLQLSIQPSSSYWGLLNSCQSVPLIAPAISGIVLNNGLSDVDCTYTLYGYQVYYSAAAVHHQVPGKILSL